MLASPTTTLGQYIQDEEPYSSSSSTREHGRAMSLSMTPLDRCMQTLSALVRLDDLEGVDFMEAAVGDLLDAAGSDNEVRIAALDHLAHAVRHSRAEGGGGRSATSETTEDAAPHLTFRLFAASAGTAAATGGGSM